MLYRAFYCAMCHGEIDVLLEKIYSGTAYRGKCITCGKISTVLIKNAKEIPNSKEVTKFVRFLSDAI